MSDLLHAGENVVAIELGNGWYNPSPLTLFAKYNLRQRLAEVGISAIAAGIGCATAAAFRTAFYAIGTSGILSFPSYMNPDGSMNSLLGWIFGNLVAFAVGFALTWITNFDNKAEAAA